MKRKYEVRAVVAAHVAPVVPAVVEGSFSFGAFDAAKKYAELYLPDYQVIPGGREVRGLYAFEALNHSIGYGAVLYVQTI